MADVSADERAILAGDGISRLPGWTVRAEIDALDRSFRVFSGNRDEFDRLLLKANEPGTAFHLWALTNRDGFERFLDEVDRQLHNFLSTALTLRDHQASDRKDTAAAR